jgi:cyclic pyranopterin phosphate synthase
VSAVQAAFPQGLQRLGDPVGEVAKNYRVPGFEGSVSFITSMTHAFCGDCNRLRLLADGSLKVCLFGANEVSLRDAMRQGASDEELRLIVSAAVDRKKAAHAGMHDLARTKNRAMVTIGG